MLSECGRPNNISQEEPLKTRSIVCLECGSEFPFTGVEQRFFAAKGYTNEPKRCPSCRELRRSLKETFRHKPVKIHNVICAECGEETMVPFKPREDKPPYCTDCFTGLKPPSEPDYT